MVPRRSAKILRWIKKCAQDGLLLYSDHARREINDDASDETDVVLALLQSGLFARQPRGSGELATSFKDAPETAGS